jgi:hypothetical protein
LRIEVGGLTISLSSCRDRIPEAYQPFLSNNAHPAHLALEVHYGRIPDFPLDREIFDSQALWSCCRSNNRYIFTDRLSPEEPPDILISLKDSFSCGDIYTNRQEGFPFSYPLDEILTINLLAHNHGLLVHACGLVDKGKGMLFLGCSSAGKSTLARLWSNNRRAKILNDDRVIIRKINDGFSIYGTPWHGEARIFSVQKAPLEKIFFIKHARKNSIKEIGPLDATARLIVCSFPPLWDKEGMTLTLDCCAELVQEIPCYELGFVPDTSILDFVQDNR